MSPAGAGRSFVRTLAPLDGAAPEIIINSITAARSLRGDLLSGKRHDEQVTGWRSPTKASRSTDGTRRPKLRFARDSPLEGDGFEPSVPLYILTVSDPLLVGPVTVPFAKRKSPIRDRIPSVRRLLPPPSITGPPPGGSPLARYRGGVISTHRPSRQTAGAEFPEYAGK
jgi:hypothetical protein